MAFWALWQSFMTELQLGADTDVPAGPQCHAETRRTVEIDISSDSIRKNCGLYEGVPYRKGSPSEVPIQTEATGYGVVYMLNEIAKAHNDLRRRKNNRCNRFR